MIKLAISKLFGTNRYFSNYHNKNSVVEIDPKMFATLNLLNIYQDQYLRCFLPPRKLFVEYIVNWHNNKWEQSLLLLVLSYRIFGLHYVLVNKFSLNKNVISIILYRKKKHLIKIVELYIIIYIGEICIIKIF